jgi:DNA-binding transcriptional ArsR family regulator
LTETRSAIILNKVVNSQEKITAIFAALADPTRRRILVRLSTGGEGPVTALAKPFRVSLPAISRHLRVLEKARLIDRRREGRVHLIRFRAAGLKQARDWMAHCAAGWDFSFDALDELLRNERRKGKPNEVRGKHQR